jgi:glycosyltransferase involved in cell wall biosynthesis
MASRLERWKGHDVLLQALGRLRDVAGWHCWVAGGAQRPHEMQYLQELQERAGREGIAGRVRFVGQRCDVPRLLCAADIHCQPNTGCEPFGIAFVEALGAGLPVVTTSIGAAPEVVDEQCGVLVPPHDVGALSEALGCLVLDPIRRAALGAAGPDKARRLSEPVGRVAALHRLLATVLRGLQDCTTAVLSPTMSVSPSESAHAPRSESLSCCTEP